MFFLIRCAFWLTVLFVAIFTQDPPREAARREQAAKWLQETQHLDTLARSWLNGAISAAEGAVASRCSKAPVDCAAMAKEFSDIAANHRLAEKTKPGTAVAAPAPLRSAAKVPLPPRRPSVFAGLENTPRN